MTLSIDEANTTRDPEKYREEGVIKVIFGLIYVYVITVFITGRSETRQTQ